MVHYTIMIIDQLTQIKAAIKYAGHLNELDGVQYLRGFLLGMGEV